jgi:arylsulfatase A-like enzyme
LFLGVCVLLCLSCAPALKGPPAQPNVLFIAVDDMNDWIRLLDPSAPIRTPSLERLAGSGMLFTRAYTASSACNPSRTALLTGLRPSTSGVYGNATDWRAALPEAVTLPQHFRANGYHVAGAGKIFHHHWGGAFHDDASFDEFQPMPHPPDAPMPPEKLNQLPGYGSPNTDWGVWPRREEDSVDHRTANFAIEFLGREHDSPFFLAVGIFRPHMPFYAPQRFFDEYPEEELAMPEMLDSNWADLPAGARALLEPKLWFFRGMREAERKLPGSWRNAVRAYQASATFADAQIGRVLDALDSSAHRDNTVIVLWSDHGYHLGEKEHWEKFALWEKTTHVPYIIVAPGVTKAGSVSGAPVDLMSVYPTLIELCGLPEKPELDGISLVPLLRDPGTEWTTPAVTTYMRGNHAVRNEHWRYIRYADGTEELYDHRLDPNEWNNLAAKAGHEDVKRRLARWLPSGDAPAAPEMKRPESR